MGATSEQSFVFPIDTFLFNYLEQNVTATLPKIISAENHPVEDGYLVSSPGCHIQSLDPFPPDVMKIFHPCNAFCNHFYLS